MTEFPPPIPAEEPIASPASSPGALPPPTTVAALPVEQRGMIAVNIVSKFFGSVVAVSDVSFGIDEHTEFPGQEYDPDVGIYGLDVTVNLVRPGYRVAKREKRTRQLPSNHRLNTEDAVAFLEREFDAEVRA